MIQAAGISFLQLVGGHHSLSNAPMDGYQALFGINIILVKTKTDYCNCSNDCTLHFRTRISPENSLLFLPAVVDCLRQREQQQKPLKRQNKSASVAADMT